ncbi:MAG: hypothetical protein IKR04_05705 [Clostridia bacterium]|nr:hypothetical protein [Clostridia bacterium]
MLMSERSFRRRRESPNKRADDDQLLDYQDDVDGIEEESFLDYPDETLLSQRDIERHYEIIGLSLDQLQYEIDSEFLDEEAVDKYHKSRHHLDHLKKSEKVKSLNDEVKRVEKEILKIGRTIPEFTEMLKRYIAIKNAERRMNAQFFYRESFDASYEEAGEELEAFKQDYSEEDRAKFKKATTLLRIIDDLGSEICEEKGIDKFEGNDLKETFLRKILMDDFEKYSYDHDDEY